MTVEGRTYDIVTAVSYAGSVTGLNVVPQGGDGVEGTWDPGVDYKVVKVTVTGSGREMDPVIMESIVSPPRVGAHEGIANARITVVPYEPFAPSTLTLPTVKITASPGPAITLPVACQHPGVPRHSGGYLHRHVGQRQRLGDPPRGHPGATRSGHRHRRFDHRHLDQAVSPGEPDRGGHRLLLRAPGDHGSGHSDPSPHRQP